MPVRVGKCGSNWCVKEPDGTTVPGGEHSSKQDAIDHAQAINANLEKAIMEQTIDSGTQAVGSNSNTVSDANGKYKMVDTTTWVAKIKKEQSDLDFPELEPEIKEAIKEKGLEEAMMFGPESFEDLDALREHNEKQAMITKVVSDFMSLVGNIISWPESGKASKVKNLAKELIQRLPDDEEVDGDVPDGLPLDDEDEVKELSQRLQDVNDVDIEGSQFLVWKQSDGTYRWLGVYSNKFRDNDHPAEILSEKSHINFIERVEKGELDYPDLYVWHIKSPIGKSDYLAYDDAGFSIVSGTIEEEFALALSETSEDLAMSHGMPSEFIERSKEDPTVIDSYVSTEVSVLPRYAAANKRTDFQILKEEAIMSIVPAEKRAKIAELLGEDLTTKLEAGLEEKANAAIAEGVEYKEESETEEVVEEVEETTDATAEEPATVENSEEKEEETEAVEAEEAVVEDEQTATPEVGDEATDGNNYVNKQELVETLASIVETITENTKAINGAIENINKRLDSMETSNKEKDEQEDLVASVPEASLQDLLRKQLAEPAKSVIGNKEAAVHGNAKLSEAKPKETEYDEDNPSPKDGLFWHRW